MSLGEAFDGILGAAQVGAPWALTRLYDAFAPPIHGYMRLRGGSEPDELTSDVFVGAFRNLESFAGGEHQFRAWLFTIARRRLVDDRRRNGRRMPTRPLDDAGTDVTGGDVEAEALDRIGDERVRRLLATLSPDQQDVLLLRLVADLTVDEIATALGKRPGAVKALQRRALATLRREIGRKGVPL